MSVVFSSWASESGAWNTGDAVTTPGATFDVPITFNIYANSNGTKGALLATKTQTVAVAYRPSTSDLCTGGRWYNSKDKTCYNGMIQMVTMSMPSVTLPNEVIWTVQYNTNHHGPNPTGVSGPADSLNVGAKTYEALAFVGTDLDLDQAVVDSTYLTGTGWSTNRLLGAIETK